LLARVAIAQVPVIATAESAADIVRTGRVCVTVAVCHQTLVDIRAGQSIPSEAWAAPTGAAAWHVGAGGKFVATSIRGEALVNIDAGDSITREARFADTPHGSR
jgi:hypothetical protein